MSKDNKKETNPKKLKKKRRTRKKLNNDITIVNDIEFDSSMEAEYYKILLKRKEEGLIKDFSIQPKFDLLEGYIVKDGVIYPEGHKDYDKIFKGSNRRIVKGVTYTADFLVVYNDGSKSVIDVKGMETPAFILRRKMFESKYMIPIKTVKKYHGEWYDSDELKLMISRRKRERTYKRKEKSKEKISSRIIRVMNMKIEPEKRHIDSINEMIEKDKNLTKREKKILIETLKEENIDHNRVHIFEEIKS